MGSYPGAGRIDDRMIFTC